MKKIGLLFFTALHTLCIPTIAQYIYPPTRSTDSSDTYFGVTYKDPYRWLEQLKEPEQAKWFKDQADLTDSYLTKIPGRDRLIAEWERLDKLQPAKYISRIYEGGRVFYQKTNPGEVVGKIYYREGLTGQEILLFDPLNYIKGKTLSVQVIQPSYDGKMLAIAYSEQGAEIATTKILTVDTKTFLPDSLYNCLPGVSWSLDNKGLLYFQLNSGNNADPNLYLHTKSRYHRLHENAARDMDFFSDKSYPGLNIPSNELPIASIDKKSGEYIFADLATVRRESFTYFCPAAQLGSTAKEWKILCRPEDDLVKSRVIRGNDVYAICYKDAKDFKLVHTTLPNPDWAHADLVVPEKPGFTLEDVIDTKDFLVLTFSDGINSYLYKYNLKTKQLAPVHPPYGGNITASCLDIKKNDCIIGITSWTKPTAEFSLDADKEIFSQGIFNKPPLLPAEYQDLVVEEVEVPAYDGKKIPLSIIYRKGTSLDGNNVCIMEGYGAYGISIDPFFSIYYNALAVKGVVIALAHVRGGGEKGQEWYTGGFKTTKPNTWKDFISCAQYLIDKKYTSPQKLCGKGTSAGGILISRSITERPDLFAAAICNVGDANAMRSEFMPSGPANIPEYGTVKDSIECRALYEMDGCQHVVKGTRYPAVICIAGWNDPRVIAWSPGKFAAAVQNASTSGKPVLLKINYDNGHFTEDKKVSFANFAGQYAFALWQCGHPDFQPAL